MSRLGRAVRHDGRRPGRGQAAARGDLLRHGRRHRRRRAGPGRRRDHQRVRRRPVTRPGDRPRHRRDHVARPAHRGRGGRRDRPRRGPHARPSDPRPVARVRGRAVRVDVSRRVPPGAPPLVLDAALRQPAQGARLPREARGMKLTWDQVLRWRLHRHHLGATKAKDPVAAARRLSGVHAQVAASAVTATDLRVTAAVTAKKIDKLLYDDRTLVRTWAARGTLHLLPAADLPTWVAAMSTRTRENTGLVAPVQRRHRGPDEGHPRRAARRARRGAADPHRVGRRDHRGHRPQGAARAAHPRASARYSSRRRSGGCSAPVRRAAAT